MSQCCWKSFRNRRRSIVFYRRPKISDLDLLGDLSKSDDLDSISILISIPWKKTTSFDASPVISLLSFILRTNAPKGRVDRNWIEPCGKAPQPGSLLVGELAQVPHYPEAKASPGGYLHRTWSFGIRSGRQTHVPGRSSASCCCNGSVGLNWHTRIWYVGSVGV